MGKKSKRKAAKLARRYEKGLMKGSDLTRSIRDMAEQRLTEPDQAEHTTGEENALFLARHMSEEDARNYLKVVAPHLLEDFESVDVVYHGENLTEEIVGRFVDTVEKGSVVGHTSTGAEIIAQADGTSFDEEGYPNEDQRADGKQVFDHAVYSARPQRWSVEELRETGDWGVADAYTGLFAVCGTQEESVGFLGALVNDGLFVDHLVWRDRESMTEVFVTSNNESSQFWAVLDEANGFAVLDRFTRLVHPIPGADWDMPYEQEVEEAMALAASFATSESPRHWLTFAEWLAPEPETVAETDIDEAVSAALTDEQPAVRVLLVSSRGWAWKGIVRELLQTYWNGIGNPPMTLVTSGMPFGAESVAQEFVEAGVHGITHEVMPDDMIRPENIDYAFAFVSNFSEGATKVVDRLRALEIPVHLVEETSAVIPDRWAGR